MKIRTLQDAEAALRPYVPLVAQLTGSDTTLERIEPLMQLLGNPEEKLRIVHIAGTSGKTSTAYYMAALLHASGQKVGLTVSPHVDKISERVQINGVPLSDEVFCRELEIFLELITQAVQPPSYFELLYAFALWVFDRQGVDYAVIETGMGGLHDATNVAGRPDKVCVITDIGFDHMHVLGYTLPEIALQKIGIVHENNATFSYNQSPEIMDVFNIWTADHSAELRIVDEASTLSASGELPDDLPLYQRRNWLLAFAVYQYLQSRDNLPASSVETIHTTQAVQVPARMEVRKTGSKTLVMDGAHNEQKMTAFVRSFQAKFPDTKPAVLVALKTGKEYEAVSPLLAGLASEIIVTAFDTSQDLPSQSMDPEVFAGALRYAGGKNVTVVTDQRLAYDALIRTEQSICIITGSFYLLSQLRGEKIV